MKGGWNIADCVERSYDVEGMHVGTVAAGRIGLVVLRRLKPFDMHPHYFDRHRRDHFRGLLTMAMVHCARARGPWSVDRAAILPDCCCLIRINAGPSVFSAVYAGRGS
jgi:D-isomer specific 2-hydroxyacid dehydrogenase, NAD binding domain